ncbi:MAG: hypothetical protein Q4P06_06010 [Actinomycetaceae bacterium]|nr:hypothetical protein [Actinomycetaceae bacterium]
MSRTTQGILIAAILAFFAIEHGFSGFLGAAMFMLVGAVLGRAAEGKLDLRGVGKTIMGQNSTTSD